MKQVEIVTPQNVTIQYDLAGLQDRIYAYLIDLAFTGGPAFFLLAIMASNKPTNEIEAFKNYAYVLPFFLFYHVTMESFFGGRSFGKIIIGIMPLKKNGEKIAFIDALMRWVFRLPDIILTFGVLAILMVSSSSAAQRIGDFFAGTVVIKTKITNLPDLNWLLKLNRQNNDYSPVYTNANHLSEKDILLIKEVSDRYKHHKNGGTEEALEMVVEKLEILLDIEAPSDRLYFLNTLIKDYVFLTR